MRYFAKTQGELFDTLRKQTKKKILRLSWSDFVTKHYNLYSDIKRDLLSSQGEYCAYCEKRIDIENSHIDHYFSRSLFTNLTYDKSNLYLSCMSNGHCGIAKDNLTECKEIDIKETIKPDQLINGKYIENFLFYTREGEIKVLPLHELSPRDFIKLEDTISKLNLNEPSLVNERKNLLSTLEKIYKAQGRPSNEMIQRIKNKYGIPTLIEQYLKEKI